MHEKGVRRHPRRSFGVKSPTIAGSRDFRTIYVYKSTTSRALIHLCVSCMHARTPVCIAIRLCAKHGAPVSHSLARGSRGTLVVRCISRLPLGDLDGRARAPTAIYAVAASAGPVGDRVSTRDRVPDSRRRDASRWSPVAVATRRDATQRDADGPLALAPNSRPIQS